MILGLQSRLPTVRCHSQRLSMRLLSDLAGNTLRALSSRLSPRSPCPWGLFSLPRLMPSADSPLLVPQAPRGRLRVATGYGTLLSVALRLKTELTGSDWLCVETIVCV